VDRRRAWFGPKRIGWGIRPRTWQGWVVVLLVIAAIYQLAHVI
jgi:hypothetical protein